MTIKSTALLLLAIGLLAAPGAYAQKGPVGTACSAEIQKLCAGIPHGQGAVRLCLEQNIAALSIECKAALESTGPGKGAGMGKQN